MTTISPASGASPRSSRRRLPRSSVIALAIILGLVLVALLGPFLVADPTAGTLSQRLLPLGANGHLLGTDAQGRDTLARLVTGARLTLLAGAIPVLVAGLLGTVLGVLAGMRGRAIRATVMRTLDVFYAFPAVLLAIAIAAALGPGMSNAVIALAVVFVPPVARVAETETVRLMGLEYMQAARASGAGFVAIALRQVLPNVAPPIVVYCTALLGLSIVFTAGLSYLGLGVVPPAAEWGLMVSENTQYLYSAPMLALVPAFMIFVVSAALNVLGDGLRDVLDVRGELR